MGWSARAHRPFKSMVVSVALASVLTVTGCSSLPLLNRDKKKRDAGPQKSEQAYYTSAQNLLRKNRFEDAARDLEALQTYYPTSTLTQQSQLDLMYARFQASDYLGAASVAERYIRLYRQDPNVDYAYYVRGVANAESVQDSVLRYTRLSQAERDITPLQTAYQNFDELVRLFPNSRYRNDAIARMNGISAAMAESEMNVARFNLKRRAWLGAASRAKWVVENYPNAPQTPEAVATLAYSYDKLGMTALAQTYRDVLKLNYPTLLDGNTVLLARAQGRPSLLNRASVGVIGRPAQSYLAPPRPAGAEAASANALPVQNGNLPASSTVTPSVSLNPLGIGALLPPATGTPLQSNPAPSDTDNPNVIPINPLGDPTRVNPVAITPAAPVTTTTPNP